MKILNVTRLILTVTIIALVGIVVTAGAPSLLVQLASATDITAATTGGQGGEGGVATTDRTTAAANNVSNAVLGSLFLSGEDKLTSFNPINETYTEVSYVGNRTIMPIDGIAAATITATETGNLTLKLQSNGITFVEGQSLLVTQGGGGNNSGGAEQQENATALLVDLNGIRPDDPRSSTGVAFFSTNSTGQLAFLDSMIAIYQVKASPEGTAIRMWEWKGADLPFGDEDDEGGTATTPEEPAPINTTTTNATTSADTNAMAASEEEGEGNEEGEDPNEFEDCVVPPGRDPSDVGC
ncbi:MAG TPA: hypothetical protein VJ643_02030 [Nitrososphaera sp.]|nr:hypothetical protein [Nitrososphaera sp.]